MKKISAVATLIIAFLFTACGEYIEMPSVSTQQDVYYQTEVFVESNDDNTIIKDAIINRGHCKVLRNYRIYKDDLLKVMEDEGDEFIVKDDTQYRKMKFTIEKNNAKLTLYKSYRERRDENYTFEFIEPIDPGTIGGYTKSYRIYKPYSEIISDPKASFDELFRGNASFTFNSINDFFKENSEYRDILKESTFGVGKIKFGNRIKFLVARCGQQIKEITLVTNGGDFTYEFYW